MGKKNMGHVNIKMIPGATRRRQKTQGSQVRILSLH